MPSTLFSELSAGALALPNRIVASPMCQYSADEGCAGDWHLQHLMGLAMSGCGLVVVESTAVAPEGRITPGCLGLYSDATEAALARVVSAARSVAPPGTAFAIQLSHAGRKASSARPWEGGGALPPDEGWTTRAPSAIAFAEDWPVPEALDADGITQLVADFAAAARRAVRAGFDAIELHMAHGYLLHEFASPLSNQRTDRHGGSTEARLSVPLAVAQAVVEAVPGDVAVGARITGSDWLADGLTPADAIALARGLRARGLSFVCVSSGGITPRSGHQVALHQLRRGAGYQADLAREIRAGAGIATMAVGMIVDPRHAEEIIASDSADMVAIARALLDDPRWVWRAADLLGTPIARPPQYQRAAPKRWPGYALARHFADGTTL